MNIGKSKEEWFETVRLSKAILDNGYKMYYLTDEKYDFIEPIKSYLDMIRARAQVEPSPNTIRSYCYDLRYFVIFMKMRNWEIEDFDGCPEKLVEYKMWLKDPFRFYSNVRIIETSNVDNIGHPLKISTQNQCMSAVSSLFLWLVASNKIKSNPVVYRSVTLQKNNQSDMLAHIRKSRDIKINTLKSKVPKVIPKTISENDFEALLKTVNTLRDKILLLCLKEGGFRSGELLGVCLEDIDFGESGFWVRFRPDNENNTRAKAGYGRDRFVVLPTDLMSLIDSYISSEWIESNPTSDFLFTVVNSNIESQNGKAMSKNTLNSIFNYYSKKLNIHFYPHMLRHTHATDLARSYIKNNEPINWDFISNRLGHSNVSTTMDIYCHLNSEDYKQEYARIKAFGNKKKGE